MATAFSLNTSVNTRFPSGVGQFTLMAPGAAAGDVTVTGIKTTDKLLLVHTINIATTGAVDEITDITAEFTITAADTINNAAGTSTANKMLLITFARTVA